MKRLIMCLLMPVFIFSGCGYFGGNEDEQVVARINNYNMTVEDLNYELSRVPHDRIYMLESEEGRREYLNNLIEKEILLQEAQRKGIDKEKNFMRSIENYWEQTLIKILLERQNREIVSGVRVYDNEIQVYYEKSGEQLPLPKVRADIRRAIRADKEATEMNRWIEELKDKSDIDINVSLAEEIIKAQQ